MLAGEVVFVFVIVHCNEEIDCTIIRAGVLSYSEIQFVLCVRFCSTVHVYLCLGGEVVSVRVILSKGIKFQ